MWPSLAGKPFLRGDKEGYWTPGRSTALAWGGKGQALAGSLSLAKANSITALVDKSLRTEQALPSLPASKVDRFQASGHFARS